MASPDDWQVEVLRELITWRKNVILLCSRQVGKTESVACAAYIEACLGGFVLIVSPSDDQSKEFMVRLIDYHTKHGLVKGRSDPTKHELLLESGGRVLARPNNEKTIRIYSAVSLLVIDEAARVPDSLYGAVSPMLAVSGGRVALLSTPFGQRGFFHKEWIGEGRDNWFRHRVPWHGCPRLTRQFIESERRTHGDIWVRQEYECEFMKPEGAYFDVAAFEELVDPELEVLQSW